MIEPEVVSAPDGNGGTRQYTIYKMPATDAYELSARFPPSAIPKIGDFAVNREMLMLLMKHVEAHTANGNIRLTTKELVDNHVPDLETLLHLMAAVSHKSLFFFRNGNLSSLFGDIEEKAKAWISSMLTDFLAQSSQMEKQASTN